LLRKLKQKNITIYDLKRKKANKKTFDSYIKKNNPQIILFNGHGAQDRIAGIDDETLVELNIDEALLEGRVIYARSCKSARLLGVSCVENGAIAFVGYKNDFVLIFTPEKSTKPLTDKIAGYFLEPSNLVIESLLKGNSPRVAHLKSQNNSIKKIKYLFSDKASQEEKSLLPFLWRNIKAQVVID